MSAITPYLSTATYARVMNALVKEEDAAKAATEYTHWLPDFVDQAFKSMFGDAYVSYADEDKIKQEFAKGIAAQYRVLADAPAKLEAYSIGAFKVTIFNKEYDFYLSKSADNKINLWKVEEEKLWCDKDAVNLIVATHDRSAS